MSKEGHIQSINLVCTHGKRHLLIWAAHFELCAAVTSSCIHREVVDIVEGKNSNCYNSYNIILINVQA